MPLVKLFKETFSDESDAFPNLTYVYCINGAKYFFRMLQEKYIV
jgi:hypothetical protein